MSIRLADMFEVTNEMYARHRGMHSPDVLICPSDHSPSPRDVKEFLLMSPHTRDVLITDTVEVMTAKCDCCGQYFLLEYAEETP